MDNLEKLKDTAKEVEQSSSTFMEPKIDKKKDGRGRKPMTDQEKAEAKKLRAEKQKIDAKASQAKGPAADSTASTASGPSFAIPSSQIMQPVALGLSSLAVRYAGDPRAQMTPDESNAFCEIGGKLLDKYAPNVFDKYGLEAVLLITLGMYGTRVIALKKVIYAEKMKQAETIKTQFEQSTPEIKKVPETDINFPGEMPKDESWGKSQSLVI